MATDTRPIDEHALAWRPWRVCQRVKCYITVADFCLVTVVTVVWRDSLMTATRSRAAGKLAGLPEAVMLARLHMNSAGKLASESLDRSWQCNKKARFVRRGVAGIEPMPSESE